MPKFPATEAKERVLAPEGAHLANVIKLIDLGTQPFGSEGEMKQKFRASFELVNEPMEDGRPIVVDQDFIFSKGQNSACYKFFNALSNGKITAKWLPDYVDFNEYIGLPCTVTVKHNESKGKMYANVTSVGPVMKGIQTVAPINELVVLDLSNFDEKVFNDLPEWLRTKIASSPEYNDAQFADILNDTEFSDEDVKKTTKKAK